MRLELNLPALERLLGGDTEVEVRLCPIRLGGVTS